MKKLLPAILLAAAIGLCACGTEETKEPPPPLDPNAVTIMGKRTDLEKTYMQRIFDLYRQTGKNINVVKIEDAEYEVTALEKFENGEAPDIFMHFNDSDLEAFDVGDNFLPLDDEPWVDDLTESAKAYCQYDGLLYGLPFWESSVSGCYYNKTILDKYGLTPSSSQASFDELCAALKQKGVTPICWPADGCGWMMQFALDPVFADDPQKLEEINSGTIGFSDIPEVKAALEWIVKANKNGWFGSDYMHTGWDDISPALSSGRAAMTFIWDTWFYTDFKPAKYGVDDFALMPVFMGTAEKGTYEGGNINMMMLNKNGEKLDEAKEFMRFCATAENYNEAFDGIPTVKCFNGQNTIIESQMVKDAQVSIAENERLSTVVTKVKGYSADYVADLLKRLLGNNINADEFLSLMDEYRQSHAL